MWRFYEDFAVGERMELGAHRFDAHDIVRFARLYDPQRFHLSEEEAAKTHFGRLCASGWHTAAIYMKLTVERRRIEADAMTARGEKLARLGGSPGFKDLRWLKPVFVDDVIAYSSVVAALRLSASMPDWGIVSLDNEGRNQHGEPVFRFKGVVFVERGDRAA
jgi:acyl dehydratase